MISWSGLYRIYTIPIFLGINFSSVVLHYSLLALCCGSVSSLFWPVGQAFLSGRRNTWNSLTSPPFSQSLSPSPTKTELENAAEDKMRLCRYCGRPVTSSWNICVLQLIERISEHCFDRVQPEWILNTGSPSSALKWMGRGTLLLCISWNTCFPLGYRWCILFPIVLDSSVHFRKQKFKLFGFWEESWFLGVC